MPSPEPIDLEKVGQTIEAEAEQQRRQDEMAQLEATIAQTWVDLVPPDPDVGSESQLLDEAAGLAAIDPQVPIGSRRGLRGVKWLIRRLSYWYVRFITDQFNVFASALIRHLRSLEDRLRRLEGTESQPCSPAELAVSHCLEDPPEPSPAVVSILADLAGSEPCLQLSSDVAAQLASADDGEFATIVLTGLMEKLPPKDLLVIIHQASRKLRIDGQIIVAVADPANRSRVEKELGTGLGLSPLAWQHLLERAGFDTRLEPCTDLRITEIVVAHRTQSPADDDNRSQP